MKVAWGCSRDVVGNSKAGLELLCSILTYARVHRTKSVVLDPSEVIVLSELQASFSLDRPTALPNLRFVGYHALYLSSYVILQIFEEQ